MNVYDSDRMADILAIQGFGLVETPESADMVILNTCHIREKAAEKVYSELGRLALLKVAREQDGGQMILAVAGCVAQAEGKEILNRAPYVDIVFGPQSYHRLPEMVARAVRVGKRGRNTGKILDTDFPAEPKFDFLPEVREGAKGFDRELNGSMAFLTVQEGCDKFCTFCVVPYTRGAEYSRPAADVLAEASNLASLGVREITLLGQNVNNYKGRAVGKKSSTEVWGLGRLIAEVSAIRGIERIRYTTSYPADVDEELIEAHRDVPALMPYLHLPIQSGSDSILRAMNRRHNADDYLRLVERLRKVRPDLGLSSDFIVGFPGETNTDFKDTLDIIKEIGFIQSYSFKYSPRPGTPAAMLNNQVPEPLKAERLSYLQEILNAQQFKFNKSCVGQTLNVLLDRPGKIPGQLVGRSPYMQAVHVNGSGLNIGTFVNLKITKGHTYSLAGVAGKGALS
jgi:tRNA-2-methylthio-N6-dimethylallyladenosine synthase